MVVSRKEEEAAIRRNLYFRGQVLPRAKTLLWSRPPAVTVLMGLAAGLVLPSTVTIPTKISDLATVGINYAALSFGASVTGAVLAISLPSEDRVRRWASNRYDDDNLSSYSDLVFALTWAALAQLAVLAVSITAIVIGGDEPLIPANAYLTHKIALGLALAIFAYGVLQLLTLISTISQLGNLIDFEEWQAGRQDGA